MHNSVFAKYCRTMALVARNNAIDPGLVPSGVVFTGLAYAWAYFGNTAK